MSESKASAPRPRGRRPAGSQSGRQQLLAAGLELFSRQGFAGTSVDEIVTAANVTVPVLYHHFGTKAGLYAEVAEQVYARVVERHETILQGEPDFAEVIDRLMALAEDLYRREPALSPMLLAVLIDTQRDPELGERLGDTVRSLRRFFDRVAALAPQELRPTPAAQRSLARALVTIMNGLDVSSVIAPSRQDYVSTISALRLLLHRGVSRRERPAAGS